MIFHKTGKNCMIFCRMGGITGAALGVARETGSMKKSPKSFFIFSCFINVRKAVVVEKRYAKDAIRFLLENDMLDDSRRISREDKKVEIPVKGNIALPFPHSLKEQEHILYRGQDVPFKEIKKKAERIIGGKAELLPKKWEKFGDVLVIKFPGGFERKEEVAKIYADVLKCRTVLEDVGGIMGVKRKPLVKHIYGDRNAETIHVENKIKFMFDASKIMFSSGNVDERIRMAYAGNEGEVVVDMFAGIGYFSIPIAVYSKTEVYACEINDVAYNYLKKNIKLNNVEKNVTALYGDCREVAPRGVADRIIMGYFKSKNFLPHAMEILRGEGVIHYHTTCPKSSFPEEPFRDVARAAIDSGKHAEMIFHRKVKSYAPGIIHGVIDVKISEGH